MDNTNIESLLIKILENQDTMKSDIHDIKSDVGTLKSDVNTLKSDVATLNKKVDKNTLVLEVVQDNMKTIAEVHSSFSLQLDKARSKDGKSIDEKFDLIELAVTNAHSSIHKVSDKIDTLAKDMLVIEAVSSKNMNDIAHLKLVTFKK